VLRGSLQSRRGSPFPMLQKSAVSADYAMSGLQISRSADLRMRSDVFDHSVVTLKQIVTAHHGYLEDLRTESRSAMAVR
jgi:hypothetical protein